MASIANLKIVARPSYDAIRHKTRKMKKNGYKRTEMVEKVRKTRNKTETVLKERMPDFRLLKKRRKKMVRIKQRKTAPTPIMDTFFFKALHGQEVCGSRLKVMLAEPLSAKETARKRVRTDEGTTE